MAQKTCPLQEVLGQIDALGEVAADPDSEDDFDGEWCDEDGDLSLHGGDVGCVCDVQSLFTQSDAVVARPSTGFS